MIKLKKLIKESSWDRKFGEPLPTLFDVIEKHGDCGCGSKHECICKITEDIKDVVKAKKLSQKLQTIEGKFRKAMYDLSDRMLSDSKNHKLQKPLEESYKRNVTKFMREMLAIVKKVK